MSQSETIAVAAKLVCTKCSGPIVDSEGTPLRLPEIDGVMQAQPCCKCAGCSFCFPEPYDPSEYDD